MGIYKIYIRSCVKLKVKVVNPYQANVLQNVTEDTFSYICPKRK